MSRFFTFSRIASLLLGTCVVSACQSEPELLSQPLSENVSNVKFSAPQRITQVRAVDRSQLRPVVQLSNGTVIPMLKTGDDSWSGSINVQPNSTYFVFVEWIETLPEGELLLAQWTQNVSVDANGAQINLSGADYDYAIDDDRDTITNIQERENNTNPFVFNEPTDNGGDDGSGDDTGSGTDTGSDAGTEPGSGDDIGAGTDSSGSNSDGGSDSGSGSTDGSTTGENAGTDSGNTTAVQPTVLIPRIASSEAPSIDGLGVELNNQDNLTGEWAAAVQFDNSGKRLFIDRLMVDVGADAEDGATLRRWAAMHDGVNLYILALADDLGNRQSDSAEVWNDDDLEIFIDGDNSKLSSWGDENDFHYLLGLLQPNSTLASNEIDGRIVIGNLSSPSPLGIVFSTGPGLGPDGIRQARYEQDVYEIAIPLAQAGIAIGSPFGFELQMQDDDDGGERNSKWGWFHPSRVNNVDTDQTYLDPSVMGTVVLE